MKQTKYSRLALACVVVCCLVLAGALVACKPNDNAQHDPTGTARFTPDDFIQLKQFTAVSSQFPDTTLTYIRKDNTITYQTTMPDTLRGGTRPIYYVLSPQDNREYTDGAWRTIAQADVDDYVQSIDNACGLVYHNVQKAYFKPAGDNVWEIESEHFFREAFRQSYELYFGKDYTDAEFDASFDTAKGELYGNLDDYTVTLDCSQPDTMRLSIAMRATETTIAHTVTYTYTAINTATIDLPPQE
mgnify:CR=1 FL=1